MEKKLFGFTYQEIKDMFLVILTLGFCFSFRNWGALTFDFAIGIANLILSIILVAIALVIHEVAHKKLATRYEGEAEFKTWSIALFLAVFICFITNGWVVFTAVWAISIIPRDIHGIKGGIYRARHWRAHLGPKERAKIAAAGPAVSILLGIISAGIAFSTGSYIWGKFMWINLWIVGLNLFPFFRTIFAFTLTGIEEIEPGMIKGATFSVSRRIRQLFYKKPGEVPYMEGEMIFWGARPIWAFLFSYFIAVIILLFTLKMAILSAILAFLISTAFYIFWQYTMEPWRRHMTRNSNEIYVARLKKRDSAYKKTVKKSHLND